MLAFRDMALDLDQLNQLDLNALADELGRDEAQREVWGQRGLARRITERFRYLVAEISSGITPIRSQELLGLSRVLANLAIDNDKNRQSILQSGGLLLLVNSLQCVTETSLLRAAAAALYNLAQDCPETTQEFADSIPFLLFPFIASVTRVISLGAAQVAEWLLVVVQSVLDVATLDELLSASLAEANVDNFVNSMLSLSQSTYVQHVTVLKLLDVACRQEIVAACFARHVQAIKSLLKTYRGLQETQSEEIDLITQILCSLTSNDETLEALSNDGSWLPELASFLHVQQPCHCQYLGTLLMGNLARRDKICIEIVASTTLSDILKLFRLKPSSKVLFGLLGLLKNLSMPKEVRPQLVRAGVIDLATPYLGASWDPVAPIQRLAVSLVRRCADHPENAVGCAAQTLPDVLALFARSVDQFTKTECARFVVHLVKHLCLPAKAQTHSLPLSSDVVSIVGWLAKMNLSGNVTLLNEGVLSFVLLTEHSAGTFNSAGNA